MMMNGKKSVFLPLNGKCVSLRAISAGARSPITPSGCMEILKLFRLSPDMWVMRSSFAEQKIVPYSSSLFRKRMYIDVNVGDLLVLCLFMNSTVFTGAHLPSSPFDFQVVLIPWIEAACLVI